MKIAISTDGTLVSKHYGKATGFIIADIRTGKVVEKDDFSTKDYTKDEIIDLLSDNQVRRIICNGIGARATRLFDERGIQVIAGIAGDVDSVLQSVTNGTIIASSESTCVPGEGVGSLQNNKSCEDSTEG
ncbi:MAG TPA: NifB/NifX family molybdenum-iron cluster-binding protein [Clostridia bacterium]|nr:NifB/NifX family molybdenum-iron cluster-binding protein [Clostridia bacterium]